MIGVAVDAMDGRGVAHMGDSVAAAAAKMLLKVVAVVVAALLAFIAAILNLAGKR